MKNRFWLNDESFVMLSQNASTGYLTVTEKEEWISIRWEGFGVLHDLSLSYPPTFKTPLSLFTPKPLLKVQFIKTKQMKMNTIATITIKFHSEIEV